MTDRRAYPSDLSDARWALIEPRLTAWRQARTDAGVGGRTATHDLREIFNAILYVNRTGIPWRYLPHDLPPWQTAYWYFTTWTTDAIFTKLNYDLTGLSATTTASRPHQPRPSWTLKASRRRPTSRLPRKAPTRARRWWAANAGSSPTPSASFWPWSSPPPASATTPSAPIC